MSTETKKYEDKMSGVINHLSKELASIRAGRANPAVLDKVFVDYYGVETPIQQVAAVSVAEARVLTISPWDASLMGAIEKAIYSSDIGITPTNDGRIMRLVFPSPTEDRRKQIVKEVLKHGEESKVSLRNIRRDAIEKFKGMKKTSEITEDDLKELETEMQKLTDKFVKEIDAVCESKKKEVMEI